MRTGGRGKSGMKLGFIGTGAIVEAMVTGLLLAPSPDLAVLLSPRNAQTRALDNCELAVFFRADFMGLMDTDAVIGYKISLALARHIGTRLREWMGAAPHFEAL